MISNAKTALTCLKNLFAIDSDDQLTHPSEQPTAHPPTTSSDPPAEESITSRISTAEFRGTQLGQDVRTQTREQQEVLMKASAPVAPTFQKTVPSNVSTNTVVFGIDRSGSALGSDGLALAENFVAAVTATYANLGLSQNVGVVEMSGRDPTPLMNIDDDLTHDVLDDILNGEATGFSPVTALIETCAELPDEQPDTIVLLTHGHPNDEQAMIDAVQRVDADVKFIGVDYLEFTSVDPESDLTHLGTLETRDDVESMLKEFFA